MLASLHRAIPQCVDSTMGQSRLLRRGGGEGGGKRRKNAQGNHSGKNGLPGPVMKKQIIFALCLFLYVIYLHVNGDDVRIILPTSSSSSIATAESQPSMIMMNNYDVSEECKRLPFIRPMGTYYLDGNVGVANSHVGIDPPFKVGSNFGGRVTGHMVCLSFMLLKS